MATLKIVHLIVLHIKKRTFFSELVAAGATRGGSPIWSHDFPVLHAFDRYISPLQNFSDLISWLSRSTRVRPIYFASPELPHYMVPPCIR